MSSITKLIETIREHHKEGKKLSRSSEIGKILYEMIDKNQHFGSVINVHENMVDILGFQLISYTTLLSAVNYFRTYRNAYSEGYAQSYKDKFVNQMSFDDMSVRLQDLLDNL